MPRRDGTGPMSGCGMGRCQANRIYSTRGVSRLFCNPNFNKIDNSKEALTFRKQILEEELKLVNEQLKQ